MKYLILLGVLSTLSVQSCISKKKYLESVNKLSEKDRLIAKYTAENQELKNSLATSKNDNLIEVNSVKNKEDIIAQLNNQLIACKETMDRQLNQVGDLTVLSKSANENVNKSLDQLAKKDQYIRMLQMAKNKADSINLALAVNLKGVLSEGIEDEDVNIKVDKTVVLINLSDKMLFKTGSFDINQNAFHILEKISKIVQSRPDIEILVEGYTDDVPIHRNCMADNWDLSVMRGASVVRAMVTKFQVDPNRLIAAGRSKFNAIAPNDTPENRALNRRTRIVIMPKLDQFYDLLDPDKVPK